MRVRYVGECLYIERLDEEDEDPYYEFTETKPRLLDTAVVESLAVLVESLHTR